MIVSYADAGEITSLSRSSIERLVRSGDFPQPVQITHGRFGFVRAEVEQWAADRIENSRRERPAPPKSSKPKGRPPGRRTTIAPAI